MNIGGAIRIVRKQFGLTQSELASRIEVTHAYISQIENGQRSPSFDLLERISYGLGVPVLFLVILAMDDHIFNGDPACLKDKILAGLKPEPEMDEADWIRLFSGNLLLDAVNGLPAEYGVLER